MSQRALYPWSTWLAWVIGLPLVLIVLGAVLSATVDVETLVFDHPNRWWLCAAGPLAGGLFLYGVGRRRSALNRFTSARLAPLLVQRMSPTRQALRAGMLVAAILLIAAALMGPRWGMYLEKQKVFGVDIVVALDVSRSMLVQDVRPNRLESARQHIREQLTERAVFSRSHRLALLAFAGSASLKLPLTTDHLAFRTKLEAMNIHSAPRGGTAIGEAIRRAVDLLSGSPKDATKIILLLTDGEDHEGGPVKAAEVAWSEHGIRVYTVGVGDPGLTVGAQVPNPERGMNSPLLHDGQIVFSKLDVDGLRKIAEAGHGGYRSCAELSLLVDAISRMRKTELTTEERMRHKPQYQWFLAAALLLLCLEPLIAERRSTEEVTAQRVWQQETWA